MPHPARMAQSFWRNSTSPLGRCLLGAVTTGNSNYFRSTTSHPATHEETARRAFQIWQENGRRVGTANDDWRAAERALERDRQHSVLNESQDFQDAMD